MKICIYGAGAIGGYLGVQLARAGADVSLVARGAHLAAMRANGLKLLIAGEEHVVHIPCTDDPAELGEQDYVIICLKAHSITGVIEQIQPLLGPRTRIVTAMNLPRHDPAAGRSDLLRHLCRRRRDEGACQHRNHRDRRYR
jgi:2-dehydropantoate 2-reductase